MGLKENTSQRRLATIILAIGAALLLLACTTILIFEFLAFRQTGVQQASTLTCILAAIYSLSKILESAKAVSNAAVKASEQRVRAVLNSAMSGVIVIDTEGKIVEWNSKAETMFGWTAAEAIGKELAEQIIPVRLRDSHRAGLARFLKTGPSFPWNYLLKRWKRTV
jgi:PAS domain-containing protein